MIDIRALRSALAGIEGAIEGDPSAATTLPDSLHRVAWLPESAGAKDEGHSISREIRPQGSPAPLRPVLELPPQDEAQLLDALAQLQPEGTVFGTPLGDVNSDFIAQWHWFHDFGSQWGVYFSASQLTGYAKALFPREALSKSVPYVWRYVLHHELFHFGVEYAIAQLECLTGKPIYLCAQESFVELSGDSLNAYNEREEALCNANALRQMRLVRNAPRGGLGVLRARMADEAPGYRDGIKYESDGAFEEEFGRYLRQAADFPIGSYEGPPALDTRSWHGVDALRFVPGPPIPESAVPIIIIDDFEEHGLPAFTLGIQSFESLVGVEESPQFKKRLAKLDHSIQKQWLSQKRRLASHTTHGFEFWERTPEGPVYSVRVGDNFRAHVLVLDPAIRSVALDIGTHKAMGHG